MRPTIRPLIGTQGSIFWGAEAHDELDVHITHARRSRSGEYIVFLDGAEVSFELDLRDIYADAGSLAWTYERIRRIWAQVGGSAEAAHRALGNPPPEGYPRFERIRLPTLMTHDEARQRLGELTQHVDIAEDELMSVTLSGRWMHLRIDRL